MILSIEAIDSVNDQYFTDDPDIADAYTHRNMYAPGEGKRAIRGNILPAYLDMKNPVVYDLDGLERPGRDMFGNEHPIPEYDMFGPQSMFDSPGLSKDVDGLIFNTHDTGPGPGYEPDYPQTQYIPRSPKQIIPVFDKRLPLHMPNFKYSGIRLGK